MNYVIYNVKDTRIWINKRTGKRYYKSVGAAKAAMTRYLSGSASPVYAISEADLFHARIEKQETKRNLLSGKEFTQPVNTPRCCDPSSELYWSM